MKGKDYSIIKYASCPSVDKEVDDAFQTRLPSIRHRSNFFDRLENLTGDVVYTKPFKNFQPV